MILSMTGFGKANCEYSNKKFSIEIKSLNSKQFDLSVKLPITYKEKELEIRNELFHKLERGKVELYINVEYFTTDNHHSINKDVVISYIKQLNEISNEKEINNIDYLNIAMRLPDTIKTNNNEITDEEWNELNNCIIIATNHLIEFRKQEGEILYKDIYNRIKIIENCLSKISVFESKRIENIRNRIQANQNNFFSNESIDKNRFEQELIYYLEKIDITEEKVRLKNHCDYFINTIKEDNSNGKKLGFIAQEIGREINTIGSKANDFEIQKLVVEMKDELEKIKEQLMNIL